jgi:hypothetical protein
MKAYMMGSAINAPNNALNISSLVIRFPPSDAPLSGRGWIT